MNFLSMLVGFIIGFFVTAYFWYQSDVEHGWTDKVECEADLPRNVNCVWANPADILKPE